MKKSLLLLMFISQILFGTETDKIFSIVKEGNIEKVKAILKETVNVNIVDEDGMSLLNHAILKNNIEVVRELIKSGANVNRKGNQGFLEIEIAIHFDNLEMLKILVENNADINALDEHGQSPLVYSILRGANKCFDYLMDLNANINKLPRGSESLLEFAVTEVGNAYVVKKLLGNGTSPNIGTFNESNLLLDSLQADNMDIAKLLIDYGYNLNKNNSKYSPAALEYIVEKNLFEIEEYIFSKFPHLLFVDYRARYGDDEVTEEPYACKLLRKNKVLFMKLMEKYPKIAELENYEGQNALLYAASSGDYELAKYFLSKGLSLNSKDFEGNTALMLAARSGNSKLTKFFIEQGMNVNEKNNKGETALMLSAKSVQPKFFGQLYIGSGEIKYDFINQLDRNLIILYDDESFGFGYYLSSLANSDIKLREDDFTENLEDESLVCDVLLKNGANLNDKSLEKWSPLTYAIVYNDYELAKFFIEKGAEVNNTSINGLTNLDFALVYGDIEILELLLNNKGYFGLEKAYNCNPLALILKFNQANEYSPKIGLDILKLLVKHGFSPNKKAAYGWLPIHTYVKSDAHLEITKYLFLIKADINAKNNGNTPLSIAVENSAIKTVKFLVSNGADLKYKTPEGKSLLSLTDDEEMVKYLKSKGVK